MPNGDLENGEGLLSEPLRAALERWYSIRGFENVERLHGGEWNDTIRFDSQYEAYVLRIAPRNTSRKAMEYSHRLLARLVPDVSTSRAVYGDQAETVFEFEGRLLSLHYLILGDPVDPQDFQQRLRVARCLSVVHQAGIRTEYLPHPTIPSLRSLAWYPRAQEVWARVNAPGAADGSDLEAFVACLRAERIDIPRWLDHFRAWMATLTNCKRVPTAGIIHGDYYPDNVLQQGGGVSGVIDWDDIRPEWQVYELARATWEFCREGEILSMDRAREFVDHYRLYNGPVPEAENDLIMPFICWTRLEDTLFDLRAALDTGRWTAEQSEYHRENLRAMRSLSEQADAF